MNIFMIDGIGPFFRNIDRRRINWSKIPFRHLDRGGFPAPFKMEAALREFETLVARSSAAGFNAISIDDLAHIAMHPDYSKRLKERIAAYRSYYKRIFEIAAQADMRIYLTSDIIFDPPGYPHPLKSVSKEILPFLKELLEELFDSFPQTAGLIIRIGECDGVDVEGDFRSILSVRTPAQCRRILEGLLPLFEARRRNLVFRLWTVGAHPVGDLIWNKHTFDKAFGGLESDALILSLKYGESDFFRYLPINPLFFRSRHRKMLELQARREYEGFGSYPSFTGWDYEAYRDELAQAENLAGVSIWTSTGGWGPFQRRTYIDDDAVWNEINTETTLSIYKDGVSTEEAIRIYAEKHLPGTAASDLITLLRYSDLAVKNLLYIDDVARHKLYFRRLRIPPLLSVYWNYVIINHSMRKVLNCLVDKGELKIHQGYQALAKIAEMRPLAERLGLPSEDIRFMYDSFEILAVAREYYFGPYTPELEERLRLLKQRYKQRYRLRYAVKMDFSRFRTPAWQLRLLLRLLLRRRRQYRRIDRILLVRGLSLVAPYSRYFKNRLLPDFMHNQAMGIKSIFE